MPARKFALGTGGWVLLLAAALTALTAWPLLRPVLRSRGTRVGDGTHAESYGFDLARLSVPRTGLAASGLPRDGLPTLDRPPVMPGSAVAQEYRARQKYLVSDDEVIGVVINGEARAYPLRVLNWHEIANDVLGGRPIAVTYNPLSDGTAVFDRVLDGRTVEFGISGLLYDSNLVMYDRGGGSLWSQLRAQAIAGPAVGTALPVLPCVRAYWGVWLALHPTTTVLRPDPTYAERYRRDPYGNYVVTGKPRFPVDATPPLGTAPMARVMAWRASPSEPWRLFPFHERATPLAAETLYAFWFAWYATHEGREAPVELKPGSMGHDPWQAQDRMSALSPMGQIEARFRVVGTRTKSGGWIWAWTDPAVPEAVRVGRDELKTVSGTKLDPSWNPTPAEVNRLVRTAAAELKARYFGEQETWLGTRYVLLFDAFTSPPPPPPPPLPD